MTKSKREVENLKTQHKSNTPVEWGQAEGFSRYLVSTDGQVIRLSTDRIVPQRTNEKGYKIVQLVNDNGVRKNVRVHRLVYMAHKGAILKGFEINHKDENKANNCIENLELMTHKENCNYGTKNDPFKKPVIQMTLSGDLVCTFDSMSEAARWGFNKSHIGACCVGLRKTHGGYIWKYAC